jgi:DNA-binding PadR family transcriptional regulator
MEASMHFHPRGFWLHERGCGGRAMRRHGVSRLFGGMASGKGFGWHGFRAGRKLGSDDLQLVILALLADQPSHGYEIIKALEERSGGFYSPSPGMIYPALTYLEEIGYATVEAEGAKKLYRISDTGRAHLEQNRHVVDAIFAQLAWVGAKMEYVRKVFAADDARTDDRDDTPHGWGPELAGARRDLRATLGNLSAASEDEQRRVAEILRRAAREIRGD